MVRERDAMARAKSLIASGRDVLSMACEESLPSERVGRGTGGLASVVDPTPSRMAVPEREG